jgi:hypothetical protein
MCDFFDVENVSRETFWIQGIGGVYIMIVVNYRIDKFK